MLLDDCERTAVSSSLDDLIKRLADIRRMRAAFGSDYHRLIGCETCQAPPGEHWPDCDPDAEDY